MVYKCRGLGLFHEDYVYQIIKCKLPPLDVVQGDTRNCIITFTRFQPVFLHICMKIYIQSMRKTHFISNFFTTVMNSIEWIWIPKDGVIGPFWFEDEKVTKQCD